MESFPFMKNSDLFSWVYKIQTGFNQHWMNIDEPDSHEDFGRRLTVAADEMTKNEIQDQGLTNEEIEKISVTTPDIPAEHLEAIAKRLKHQKENN